MAEKSHEYTTFTTYLGNFQYKRMPFGLYNVPAIFQELMYVAIKKHIVIECYAYMDDIIIFPQTNKQH
ncbi:hypothetical protein PAEPH01_1393 [Pancytospora epiphaga]|nr:hypothetical protein PAEPH01_1393 [Pancytospora epiphaga]